MFPSINWRVVFAVVVLFGVGVMTFTSGRNDLRRIADIRAEGRSARATIAEVAYFTRKGGHRTWYVALEWRDPYGGDRSAGRVLVSESFARSHSRGSGVRISYLLNRPADDPLILDDEDFAAATAASTYQRGHMTLTLFSLGALYLGVLFAAFRYVRKTRFA